MHEDGFWTRSRVVSAIVVAVYVPVAYGWGGGEWVLRIGWFCALPIFCIWFPEFMGQYRSASGWFTRGITEPTPAIFVFVMGWIVLFLPVVVAVLYYFNT